MFSFARNFAVGDEAMSKLLYEGSKATFLEDAEMLEAVQRNRRGGSLDGLVDIAGDGYVAFSDAVRVLERANILQLREMFVTGGIASDAEIERFLAWLDEPRPGLASPFVFSAWGRRPGA